MAITGTNHGLSVLTNAAAEERLQWPFKDSAGAPAIFSLSTTFNDATSGAVYAHASGHEGIDFACGLNTRVCAMYAGVVIAVIDEYGPTTGAPYGNFVTIQSHTNPANNAGFEHTYAHLSTVAVACGDMVDKGDTIGQSGNTGRVPAHLHVHLKPFDRNGNVPCPWEDEPLQVSDHQDSAHSPIRVPYFRLHGLRLLPAGQPWGSSRHFRFPPQFQPAAECAGRLGPDSGVPRDVV